MFSLRYTRRRHTHVSAGLAARHSAVKQDAAVFCFGTFTLSAFQTNPLSSLNVTWYLRLLQQQ